MKTAPVLLGVTILVALSAGIYYAVTASNPASADFAEVAAPTPRPLVEEVPTKNFLTPLVKATPEPGAMEAAAPTSAPALSLDSGLLPWEKEILAVLQDPLTGGTKGARLLAMLPTLPEEALQPATQQALTWTSNQDYGTTVLPFLLDGRTHGAVMSEMFRDLMEHRPPAITMPSLLAIARNGSHPFAEVARQNLEAAVGQDLGEDWPAWEAAVRQRLAPQP